MSHIQKTFSAAMFVTAATLVSGSAFAGDDATSCPFVTHVQRRIVERANESMESLRSYVWRTNIVQRINMNDVKESLDSWRAAVACQQQVASAAATVELASKAADDADR